MWSPQKGVYFSGKGIKNNNVPLVLNGPSGFDVELLDNKGANAEILFHDPGYLHAKTVDNEGRIYSDNILDLQIETLRNHQTVTSSSEGFVRSFHDQTVDLVSTTKALPTGEIYAQTLQGTIGSVDQLGGSFGSGTGGTHVLVTGNMTAKALRTDVGIQYELKDQGRNYEIQPKFHGPQIGSAGEMEMWVDGVLETEGVHVYSGKEGYFGGRIHNDKPATAQYHKATFVEIAHHGLFHKTTTATGGGTGTVVSQSIWENTEGDLNMVSENGHMEAPIFITPGNLNCNGNKLSITAGSGYESTNQITTQKGLLSFATERVREETTTVYSPLYFVGGDVNFNFSQEVRICALKGFVGGDVNVKSPVLILEGAQETDHREFSAKSFGIELSPQILDGVWEGQNAKNMLNHFVKNDSIYSALNSLAHAQDGSDVAVDAVTLAAELWQLTALTAYACNETGCSKDAMVGALFDRWGLTKVNENGERSFNPDVTLRFGKSKGQTTETIPIGTELRIGGQFFFDGNRMELRDGAIINAKKIVIFAKELLSSMPAISTVESSEKSVGLSVDLDVRNQSILSVGANGSKVQSSAIQYANAGLISEEVIIEAGKINGDGLEIHAKTGSIKSPEITLISHQDKSNARSEQISITVSADKSGSGNYAKNKTEDSQTHEISGIYVDELALTTNRIISVGSVIDAPTITLKRFDQEDRPIEFQGEPLHDKQCEQSIQIGGSLSFSKEVTFPVKISGQFNEQEVHAITQPSVFSNTILPDISPTVNQDRDKLHLEVSSKNTAIGAQCVIPNSKKIRQDLSAMIAAKDKIFQAEKSPMPQDSASLPVMQSQETDDLVGVRTNDVVILDERPVADIPEPKTGEIPDGERSNSIQPDQQELNSSIQESGETEQLLKNLEEFLGSSGNSKDSAVDPYWFTRGLVESYDGLSTVTEGLPKETEDVLAKVGNFIVPTAQACPLVIAPELLPAGAALFAGISAWWTRKFNQTEEGDNGANGWDGSVDRLETQTGLTKEPNIGVPSSQKVYENYLAAQRELFFAKNRLQQEGSAAKLGEQFVDYEALQLAQSTYEAAKVDFEKAELNWRAVQDKRILKENSLPFPIEDQVPSSFTQFPPAQRDPRLNGISEPTRFPIIKEAVTSYETPNTPPRSDLSDPLIFPIPPMTSLWALYKGDKTKGVATPQVSDAGLNKPVPLLSEEKRTVDCWTQALNQYGKKNQYYQSLDWLSEETKTLLIGSSADRSIMHSATPDDLAAILKEGRGISIIKPDGSAYDHYKEWQDTQNAIAKLVTWQTKSDTGNIPARIQALQKQGLGDSMEVKLLQEKYNDVRALESLYQDLIKEATCRIKRRNIKR
ncbi:MAG TPA: hypothetical protein VJ205_04605 [Gammaproteobacteria bacterium]|nr:hypothetical protein [Gammaproteobacteria bacterium]